MYLYQSLLERAASMRPVRVGLIGAGKFGAMFLSQVPTTPAIQVTCIADLDPDGARKRCRDVGWEDGRMDSVRFVDDASALISSDDVDVVVEATGNPVAGVDHALQCIGNGKHAVMVNVEADVLAGPYLAHEAAGAGVVYTMAYGDQPALIVEMVEWARSCGFRVTAAGKGTKYLPEYHASTPDTVWAHYGLSAGEAAAAGMRSQMFNSFLDGTKSAIEMAAVANAADLGVPANGLAFPPCGCGDLARVLRPRGLGGQLEQAGQVEVVSSLERDGRPVPDDLRWGVFCVFEAPNDYTANCFREYGMNTDPSGRYSAMYKPFHLIGLELNISIFSAAFRSLPVGSPQRFRADVASVAKRDLVAGETLDGEGGYTVWGRLMSAQASIERNALPIGLSGGVRVRRAISKGDVIGLGDVVPDKSSRAWAAREHMVRHFHGTVVREGNMPER